MDLFGGGPPTVPREFIFPALAACLAYLAWLFRAPLLRGLRFAKKRKRL